MPSKTRLWLPLAGWMALIFLFSTDLFSGGGTGGIILPILGFLFGWAVPDSFLYTIHFLVRKGAHLTEYAILGLLWYRAINPTLQRWNFKTAFRALFLSSLYAVTDEFHQTLTLTREGRAEDVMIDSSGALIAIISIWFYNLIINRVKNNGHRQCDRHI